MKITILLLSITGIIIASIWMYVSGFQFEPITVLIASLIGLLYQFKDGQKSVPEEPQSTGENTVNQNPVINVSPEININTNYANGSEKINNESKDSMPSKEDILDIMKKKVSILFVDDDTGFRIVKILKDSGWTKTSTVKDIKSIDMPVVKNANILFIDNHGVGKLLNCENEGLDLVKMIKEKYNDKIVVIYSGDSQANMFHEAINLADYRLIKNALPYEFQKIIEKTSLEIFKKNNIA